MNNREKQAEIYAEEYNDCYTNDYHGFINGYDFAQKELEQKIANLYNKYNSQLKEENNPKLTKVINKERVLILSSKVQVLGELKNKLEK